MVTIEFASIDDRDAARDALLHAGLKIRTGKTLVPFRLSGNVAWGVPATVDRPLGTDLVGLVADRFHHARRAAQEVFAPC